MDTPVATPTSDPPRISMKALLGRQSMQILAISRMATTLGIVTLSYGAMVYIADRLGTSQQILINMVAEQLRKAQADNTVRSGDPRQLATMALLITQSVIQSAQIVSPILDGNALNAELSRALNGYLRP